MNYTVEDLDRVMEETKASYQEVKAALGAADGNADEAIEALKGKKTENKKLDDLKEKLTNIIKKGNAKKVVVRRKGEEIISVPLNLGIIGGIVGVAAAPVAVIVAAIAAYGFDCTVEVENKDGSKEEVD
ncbi:MAG: DUF4342 domain-containing protein [Clostridiales bacterium]|nr:DUF4342 domain-containing protein [Clostridiales bacterium]